MCEIILNCKLYCQQLHLKYWCNWARYRLQAVWGWQYSVETCSSVIICEIIVHWLVLAPKEFFFKSCIVQQSVSSTFCIAVRGSDRTNVCTWDVQVAMAQPAGVTTHWPQRQVFVGVSTTVTSFWGAANPNVYLQPGKGENRWLVKDSKLEQWYSPNVSDVSTNILYYLLNRIWTYIFAWYILSPDFVKDLLISWQSGKTLVFLRRSMLISFYLHRARECNRVIQWFRTRGTRTLQGYETGH
jgi:hypothetical protein